MSLIQATIRSTKTRGELNTLRKNGSVPGIIYGGENANEKISLSKQEVKNLINKENFLSNVISIKLDEKEQKVLPREITFDTISDEPTHIDFLRIVKGSKIILEIPVKFINNELSPGLKRGGVLNVVRYTVEVICPVNKIPESFEFNLEGLEIGDSIHISHTKIEDGVEPTIKDRDFTVASILAPSALVSAETSEDKAEEEEDKDKEGAEESKQERPPTTRDQHNANIFTARYSKL